MSASESVKTGSSDGSGRFSAGSSSDKVKLERQFERSSRTVEAISIEVLMRRAVRAVVRGKLKRIS